MSVDVIDEIRKAEVEAESIKKAALSDAKIIVSEAENESYRILAKYRSDAEEKCNELLEKAKKDAEPLCEKISENAKNECVKLQKIADSNMNEATQVIIRKVVGEN